MNKHNTTSDSAGRFPAHSWIAPGILRVVLGLIVLARMSSPAGTVLGPWVPMFEGIDHAVGTNTAAGGGFPDLQVVHFLRVDLTDTNISLFASPRRTNWVSNGTETYGLTTTNFLKSHNLQVAINANQFFIPGSSSPPGYTLAEGTAFNINGLFISQGQLVSPGESADDASTLYFTISNTVTFYPTNWPVASTAGIYTAVSGPYAILYHGVNIGSNYVGSSESIHELEPRTAFGISQDKRYLLLLVIDGRQNGYSTGAYDWETAEWLKLAGAYDGANMDGGGSTCMAVMDTTGKPVPLNRDSAAVGSGRERTVGAHFGIYAAPLPGFFNDVKALPDDTAATITWTTISAATTQLKYGTGTNMTSLTASDSTLLTSHAVLLTNLTPNTGYYFMALASNATGNYVSSNYLFLTTNYVTTNALFELTNSWKYTTTNLDGVDWTPRTYNDAGWDGEGPGLLWSDIRGANPNIADLNTQMPEDFNSGYPFTTYYFRAHFNFTNSPSDAMLQLGGYFDDGALFYLNGVEINRLRMPAVPTTINNATVATGFPCAGDADCLETISVAGPVIATNLLSGDNVLAVEVHNYSTGSPDITFGLKALLMLPCALRPTLTVTQSNSAVRLEWSQGGYTLQLANTPTSAWINVPGPVISSPFITTNPTGNRFFRLFK